MAALSRLIERHARRAEPGSLTTEDRGRDSRCESLWLLKASPNQASVGLYCFLTTYLCSGGEPGCCRHDSMERRRRVISCVKIELSNPEG